MPEVKRILIAAAMSATMMWSGTASAFDGTISTDKPTGWARVHPPSALTERSALLFGSLTARRFRADCPTFAETDDNFQQHLDRIATWMDELDADATTVAKLNETIEGYIAAWERDKYCANAAAAIRIIGRLQ